MAAPRRGNVQLGSRRWPDHGAGAAGRGAVCWTVTDSLDDARPLTRTPAAARSSLDAPAAPGPKVGKRLRRSGSRRRRSLSLLWWVFLANASVLAIALLLLTFSPITIDAPIEPEQFALLLAGFVVMLVLNVLLLRRVLSPLSRLTEVMSSVDPDRPGRRLSGVDPLSTEGEALADAFNAMLDRLESARREAARTALAAQEGERLRVAQELHDEIGQTLTAVTIQAERAADGDPALAADALRSVADAVRESLDEVRRIARELRPEALDDLGLVNALIALCNRVAAQDGPQVRRELQGNLPALSPDVELVVYRIAQEGLTNALRHSHARSVTLSLTADAETMVLRVFDDGMGMPADLPGGTAGIAGMRERALLVGGRLSIESRPQRGTEVRLVIPVDRVEP
jgi:two-component system, NarL family, sensor histidine kinase UhpB